MNTTALTTPEHAAYVWTDPAGTDRNTFALFRRVIDLESVPDHAELNLFLDSRYRLRVNGVVASYGPVRFVPAHPVADLIDLRPYLRPGSNVIVVEGWCANATSFQAMPEDRAGFIAWGSVAGQDLATPGDWQALQGAAWDPQSPPFSFAQGPVEICDTSLIDEAWFTDPTSGGDHWGRPVPIDDTSVWGPLTARTLPPASMDRQAPAAVDLLAPIVDDEERLGYRSFCPPQARKRVAKSDQPHIAYAACIHSPRAQKVPVALFWGDNYCNGVKLDPDNDPVRGNRQIAQLDLHEGWNLLYGELQALTESWGVTLGIPRDHDLSARARPDADDPHALRATNAVDTAKLPGLNGRPVPATAEELPDLPWIDVPPQASFGLPAREAAWDVPGEPLAVDHVPAFPYSLQGSHVLVLDMGAEFLGHPRIEVDVPAGTVIDICVDERKRSDGLLALFASSPFTDAADRFIARGGRQVLEGFHPRGGRWLQLHIRPPAGGDQAIRIIDVGLRRGQVLIPQEGTFSCSDPIFDWTWQAAYETLQACTEDAFLDCPWRERGTYLGDALVEAGSLRAFTRDEGLTERCIDLWAQGQMDDGQMQACVPSWHRRPHEDFTLIWILLVHDHWVHTGSLDHARGQWQVVEGIFASPSWRDTGDGLWSATGLHCFIDWGTPGTAKQGDNHGPLNAFRYRALRCAAELARALGRDDGEGYDAQADAVRDAFRRVLWSSDHGRFALACNAGERDHHADLHANILALAFGLCDDDQRPQLLDDLVPRLHANLAFGVEHGQGQGHAECYFLSYVLPALYENDQAALAETLIRDTYGLMRDRGAWTLWECFCRGVRDQGSLSHAWSCAPVIAFHRHTLGVQPTAPGVTDAVRIAPDSALPWARGSVPHPRGLITVHWRREGDTLWLEHAAPAGVQVEVGRSHSMRDCRMIVNGSVLAD